MSRPQDRLHSIRGGDGSGLPNGRPPEIWPDFDVLAPYWSSFVNFALSEMGRTGSDDITTMFHQYSDGSWEFRAESEVGQKPRDDRGEPHTQMLVYDSTEDTMEFTDTLDGSSWVMETAFGDQMEASSRL